MRQCSPRMCCSPRRSQPQFVVAPVMAGLEGVVGTPMWKHLRHRFEKHRDLGRFSTIDLDIGAFVGKEIPCKEALCG